MRIGFFNCLFTQFHLYSNKATQNDLLFLMNIFQQTVQKHDNICSNIQNYSRLQNGENSLGRYTHGILVDASLPSCPPLCLTTSFETNTTTDDCSSTTTTSDAPNCETTMPNRSDEIIEIIGRTQLGQFDSVPYDQQLLTAAFKMPPSLSHNSDNRAITQCLLTREQVLDKMEIARSKSEILAAGSGASGTQKEYGEDQGQECSICMEAFKVGDVVSFSPAEGCYHVFHHNCLRRWLLRKTDCPCCRVTMLPIDRPKPKDREEQRNEEVSPPTDASRIISSGQRRSFRRPGSPQIARPWYHKNASVRNERMNKKCGTYYCVACGVVELKTHLREDLLPRTKPFHETCDSKT